MLRIFLLGSLISLVPTVASAQKWAEKMFDATAHDFGTVARGAKTTHVFTVTNLYKETVHIAGIAKSCGCTSAVFDRDTLKTHEKARLSVEMDTLKFTDRKSSTLTITFDQPFFAQVKVPISAYIRRDVVLSPGEANFGTIPFGEPREREIQVKYAGRSDWRIESVRNAGKFVDVALAETQRDSGRVSYRLVVQLKPDAAIGYFRDQLTLITNDARAKEIPLIVEGKIESEITVSPGTLSFGVVRPGQTVTRQIVVRGKKPFSIVSLKPVAADNPDNANANDSAATPFEIKLPEEKKALHLIPVTLTAPETPGTVRQQFRIETDLPKVPPLEFSTHCQVAN